jgi:hypothetical protein
MLTTRSQPVVPLADAAEFDAQAGRTTRSRLILAVAIAALGLAAFLLARDLGQHRGAAPRANGGGVLVLDLSTSVGPDTYTQIRRTFRQLTTRRERLGLVIFSDTAYEVIPPGIAPVELEPIARFFKPHAVPSVPTPFPPRLIENPRFYDNPWTSSYHGGTQISKGLTLAERMLRRDGIEHGRVILVSDLNESSIDRDRLTKTLLEFAQRRVKLDVVDLSIGSSDRRLYSQLTGRPVDLTLAAPSRPSLPEPSPYWLVAAALALVLLLAGNEYWCRRLWWRRAQEAGS